jgi:hypothetical protein
VRRFPDGEVLAQERPNVSRYTNGLKDSATRLEKRSLLLRIENAPSMMLDHEENAGMKSISILIESSKAGTREEWWNTTLRKRRKSPDVLKKSLQ